MPLSEFTLFLLQISVMLTAALTLGQIVRRFGLPAVVGEILAGILLGPTALGMGAPSLQGALFPATGVVAVAREAVVKVSLLCFLFAAGMEMNLSHVWRQRWCVATTSLLGILVPFIAGYALTVWYPGFSEVRTSHAFLPLFMGTALSISALPVIARTLMDLNLQKSDLATTILAAAMIDDLMGWCLFETILSRIDHRSAHTALVEWLGVHAVFGAFLAGVFLAQAKKERGPIRERAHGLALGWLAPIYFVSIGLKVNFSANFDFGLTAAVIAVACLGKVAGAGLGAWIGKKPPHEALAIGFGMNSRGAMEIILASLALEFHLINGPIFVALVLMALFTSILSGPIMARVLEK